MLSGALKGRTPQLPFHNAKPSEVIDVLRLRGLFSLFLLAGCCIFVVIVWFVVVVPWRVNHHFQETTCVVVDKRIASEVSHGVRYRPEILIQYEVEGQNHQTWTFD